MLAQERPRVSKQIPPAPQPHEQAPSARREPDPSRGHLRLHLLGCFGETRHPEGQSPKGVRVMGAARRGEAEPLLRLPGHGGGARFTLTGALEGARNWKFWLSFSNKAEAVLQRDYFCTTETGTTRSLHMQMLTDLKQEWLKRSLPRKEKALLLHSTSTEPSLKNRAEKAFFGAELKNFIRSVLLH